MRRENRDKQENKKVNLKWWRVASFAIAIILLGIAIVMSRSNQTTIGERAEAEEASSEISQSVNEVQSNILKGEMNLLSGNETNTTVNTEVENKITEPNTIEVESNVIIETGVMNEAEENENIVDETNILEEDGVQEENSVQKNEVSADFIYPVEGEVIKEFAKDSLIYSETLEEWITHTGIDIKADKTTVVKATAKGTVKSIKNDPRYGLTITIEHDNGYTSVYSSLLSAEFVTEGEEVEQGQTIGTVGNSAVFEVSEDSHLHFELLKDGTAINPEIYLK